MVIVKTEMQEEAIQAGLKYSTVYLPFMLKCMDDVCIRITLSHLKKCWLKLLKENGMHQDMPNVIKILKWFPQTSATVRSNNTFANEMDVESFDYLFEENSEGVDSDVRSQAISLFNEMCSQMTAFMQKPPTYYYLLSHQYFVMKISILNDSKSQIIGSSARPPPTTITIGGVAATTRVDAVTAAKAT